MLVAMSARLNSSTAKMRNVERVPTVGISSSTGMKAPRMLPMVLTAKTWPARLPAGRTSVVTRRMAKGDTMPSMVRGTASSSRTPTSEPKKRPPLREAMAWDDTESTGFDMNGTSPTRNDAIPTMLYRMFSSGRRSARRPPIQ